MAGSPTCGKMSTGIRRTARSAKSAIAIRATTTVMGRLSAARTNRMHPLAASLAGLQKKRLKIAGRGCNLQQAAPYTQPSQRVVDLRLCEQALGFRHFIDVG